jgi:hypothetical protein
VLLVEFTVIGLTGSIIAMDNSGVSLINPIAVNSPDNPPHIVMFYS